MASLVQDVWLGWEPRLRGPPARPLGGAAGPPPLPPRRRARPSTTRPLAAFLEALAERLEVMAWEPRGQGGSAGRFGPEVLDDARRLATEGASRWGALPARRRRPRPRRAGWPSPSRTRPACAAAFALAPSLAGAGPEPSSPLRAALAAAFARAPLAVPTLVVEGRERPAAEAEAVSQWLAREPRASRLVAGGRRRRRSRPALAGRGRRLGGGGRRPPGGAA